MKIDFMPKSTSKYIKMNNDWAMGIGRTDDLNNIEYRSPVHANHTLNIQYKIAPSMLTMWSVMCA